MISEWFQRVGSSIPRGFSRYFILELLQKKPHTGKEIIDYANTILKLNQLANTIDFTNLNSEDPEPTAESLEWDASVDTYADLTYINTADLSGTLNYLVKADENINGFWAIYNWDGSTWSRTKVQTYKTR